MAHWTTCAVEEKSTGAIIELDGADEDVMDGIESLRVDGYSAKWALVDGEGEPIDPSVVDWSGFEAACGFVTDDE